jgi:hypothetical protein
MQRQFVLFDDREAADFLEKAVVGGIVIDSAYP